MQFIWNLKILSVSFYIYHHNVIQSLFCCLLVSCTDNRFSFWFDIQEEMIFKYCIFHDYCMKYIKYYKRRKLDMVKYRRNNKKISNEMIWYTRRDDLQILVEEEAERNIHFAWGMMCFKHAIFPFACHNALCMCVSLALQIIMIAAD